MGKTPFFDHFKPLGALPHSPRALSTTSDWQLWIGGHVDQSVERKLTDNAFEHCIESRLCNAKLLGRANLGLRVDLSSKSK